MEKVIEELRQAPVVRTFPTLAAMVPWMDALDAACAARGMRLQVALDEVHASVIVYRADRAPGPAELERLAGQAAAAFHRHHGVGECGRVHTDPGPLQN